MAYTDRFYATSDDDAQFPNDPFRKYFGGGARPSPTPKPTPTPTQVAMLGPTKGLFSPATPTPATVTPLTQNAASRVNANGSRYIAEGGRDLGPQYDDQGRVNPLPRGAVGVQGSPGANDFNVSLGYGYGYSQSGGSPSRGGFVSASQEQAVTATAPRMTHTEMAVNIARRNLAAQYPTSSLDVGAQGGQAGSQYFASNETNLAASGSALRAATAYRPTLETATLPGKGALDIVPPGTPLMSVKGIVNPFTGQTSYQPINQTSPYQGPAKYQIEQGATDFYRKRNEGYGSAYQ